MADEQKSRLTSGIALMTAVSGLIAALVALSGALKPMFGTSGNTMAPVAPLVSNSGAAVLVGAGNTALPVVSLPGKVVSPGGSRAVTPHNGGASYHDTGPAPTHAAPEHEASPTHDTPAEHSPSDDSTPPDQE